MIKCRLSLIGVLLLAVILTLAISVGNVAATQSTNVIPPKEEVTKTIDCGDGCVSIRGNLSVVDGSLDFYATSPSGKTLFFYNNTGFKDFNITTTESGNYTLHLRNPLPQDSVTAILNYGRNFVVALQATFTTSVTTTTFTTTTTITPPPPNWIGPMAKGLSNIVWDVVVGIVSTMLVVLVGGWLGKKYQKWKDGPSKTPVVMKPQL